MAPSRTITTEITHARTGRSMKKRASTAGPLSEFFGLPGICPDRVRHVHEFRLDRDARPHLLQAVDDHPLARLQAVGDLAQTVMKCPQPDGARTCSLLANTPRRRIVPILGFTWLSTKSIVP